MQTRGHGLWAMGRKVRLADGVSPIAFITSQEGRDKRYARCNQSYSADKI